MEGGDKGGYPDGEWFVYISYFKLFTLSFCLLHQSSGILLAPNFPLPQFGWEEEGRRQKRKFTWNQNSDVRSLRNLVNTSYIHVKQTQHSFNLHIIHHPSAIHEMYSRWSKGRKVDICVQTAGTSSRVCCTAVSRDWDAVRARVIVNILGIYRPSVKQSILWNSGSELFIMCDSCRGFVEFMVHFR